MPTGTELMLLQVPKEEGEEPKVGSALAYLQRIYKNPMQPEGVRIRAAALALPFETPKLAVTGYVRDDGTFAQALDRAIQRSRTGRVTLELSATPGPQAQVNGGAGEVAPTVGEAGAGQVSSPPRVNGSGRDWWRR